MNPYDSRSELLRDLEIIFVEQRILTQDDLQTVGFFELTQELAKRALKIMRNSRVDHEGDLLAEVGRGRREQLTPDFETYSR